MQQKALSARVTLLENKMQGLPERVGALESGGTEVAAQFAQLREESRSGVSAIRGEMAETGKTIREDLRREIRGGDEETRRLMRVLHEDLVARIALIDRR